MQGDQPTLPELGHTDYQPVRRDVVVSEVDRLGNAKSRTRQQREESAVSLSAQGAVSRLSGQLNDLANLLVGENVRSRSRPALLTKNRRRYLMTSILSLKI